MDNRIGSKFLHAGSGYGGSCFPKDTAALLGLIFKPNTDDMRDAPSIAIAQTLADAGVHVVAYDPEGMEAAAPLMPEVKMVNSAFEAVTGVDVAVVVTEWDAFRAIDLERLKGALNAPVLIDLRNVFDPADARAKGFQYTSIGRQ